MAILKNKEIQEIKDDAKTFLADDSNSNPFDRSDAQIRIDLIETIELLQGHNDALFQCIKKIIEGLEKEPCDENETHTLIAGHEMLIGLKESLIKAGYEF